MIRNEENKIMSEPSSTLVEHEPEHAPEHAPEPDRVRLPHETVYDRLRERARSAKIPHTVVVESAQERIELPYPAKRSDAFTGAGKYLSSGAEHGWDHRATYTRVRDTSAAHGCRHIATVAIRWRRGPVTVLGYWRTGAAGRYVFAFGQVAHAHAALGSFGPAEVSAKGVAAALALAPERTPEGWREALAPYRPSPAAVDADGTGPE
jgi:hypothetical protein